MTSKTDTVGEMTFGEGFCKCCLRQIKYIGMIYVHAGEMCFFRINLHIELFNGVRHCVRLLRWQHLSPVHGCRLYDVVM